MRPAVRMLVRAALGFPLLYAATLTLGSALDPVYSDVRQVPSDLGRVGAPHAGLFNFCLLVTSLCGIAGSAGIGARLRTMGAALWQAAATGVSLGLFAGSLLMASLLPLPSPWHSPAPLVLAGVLFPALAAIAWPGGAGVRTVLWILFLLLIGLVAAGFGGLVADTQAGLWIRAMAAVLFGSVAVLAAALRRESLGDGRESHGSGG